MIFAAGIIYRDWSRLEFSEAQHHITYLLFLQHFLQMSPQNTAVAMLC